MIPNAEILLSTDLLRIILDLPADVEVIGAAPTRTNDWRDRVFRLAVDVAYLPSIEERGGGRPYLVTPVYRDVAPGKTRLHDLHVTPPDPAGTG